MCHNSVQFLSNAISAVKSIILLNISCLQLSKTKGNSDKEPKTKHDQAQSGNQFSSGQTNECGVIIPSCITSQIVDWYQRWKLESATWTQVALKSHK